MTTKHLNRIAALAALDLTLTMASTYGLAILTNGSWISCPISVIGSAISTFLLAAHLGGKELEKKRRMN